MDKIIVGLVGTIGSGKTTVAQKLEHEGFINLRFSLPLEREILARALTLERINYQNVADDLRKTKGADYLSNLLLQEADKKDSKEFVIDGFRNPAEIKPFRERGNFILIGLDTDLKVRFQRLVNKSNERSPKNWQDFQKQENRDNGEGEPQWGQNIFGCLKEADFIIDTDKNETIVYKEVSDQINKFKETNESK